MPEGKEKNLSFNSWRHHCGSTVLFCCLFLVKHALKRNAVNIQDVTELVIFPVSFMLYHILEATGCALCANLHTTGQRLYASSSALSAGTFHSAPSVLTLSCIRVHKRIINPMGTCFHLYGFSTADRTTNPCKPVPPCVCRHTNTHPTHWRVQPGGGQTPSKDAQHGNRSSNSTQQTWARSNSVP